jgi:hypothetical protein
VRIVSSVQKLLVDTDLLVGGDMCGERMIVNRSDRADLSAAALISEWA